MNSRSRLPFAVAAVLLAGSILACTGPCPACYDRFKVSGEEMCVQSGEHTGCVTPDGQFCGGDSIVAICTPDWCSGYRDGLPEVDTAAVAALDGRDAEEAYRWPISASTVYCVSLDRLRAWATESCPDCALNFAIPTPWQHEVVVGDDTAYYPEPGEWSYVWVECAAGWD